MTTLSDAAEREPIVIVPYDAAWPARFQALARAIRAACGTTPDRIDHIGSTAVPGLAAKPIIDIQLSVATFTPDTPLRVPLEHLGYRYRPDNPERTKRYFREPPGTPRTHLHVRLTGIWHEQFALLFRDYLRAHPEAAAHYAARKSALAAQFPLPEQRSGYTEGKGPCIWATMQEADRWAQRIGWQPGPSDA